MLRRLTKKEKGFTLVELMVVILIIAILVAIAIKIAIIKMTTINSTRVKPFSFLANLLSISFTSFLKTQSSFRV